MFPLVARFPLSSTHLPGIPDWIGPCGNAHSLSDADQAQRGLLALGATRVRGERETGFRVFNDPAGHPFCIVFGHHSAD